MQEYTPSSDWRKFGRIGYFVIFLTFGVGGGWAALTKIDRAVIGVGLISVDTNRKTVQNLEGGIVDKVLVREGEHVRAGQVLLRLMKVQAQAQNEQLRSQLGANLAIEARLLSERQGSSKIIWPPEVLREKENASIARVMEDQQAMFDERSASLQGQIAVLQSRIYQLETEIRGHAVEKKSTENQVFYIEKELKGMRLLSQDGLISVSRLYAMERERTRLEGVIGRHDSDTAKAHGLIGEVKIQMQQLTKKLQEDIASQISDVRQKIGEVRERLTVAKDILDRVDVVSPRDGTVQNLKVFSQGQVIRSGEPLLEVVPTDEALVVSAQFSPNDIDGVKSGQEVEIRFPAFHMRSLPVMLGHLESLSTDRLIDDATKQPYFLARISLDRTKIPEELRERLRPGMPAEVIAATGERTVLDYMIAPLANSARKAFREN